MVLFGWNKNLINYEPDRRREKKYEKTLQMFVYVNILGRFQEFFSANKQKTCRDKQQQQNPTEFIAVAIAMNGKKNN